MSQSIISSWHPRTDHDWVPALRRRMLTRREEEEFYDLAFFFLIRPRRRSIYAISIFTSVHSHIQHTAHTLCIFLSPFFYTTFTPTYTRVPKPTSRAGTTYRRPGALRLFTADDFFPMWKSILAIEPDSARHSKFYWVYAPLQCAEHRPNGHRRTYIYTYISIDNYLTNL